MAKLSIYSQEAKEVESIDIPDEIFAAPVNNALLHQAVVKYLASKRQGNASTKTKAEVSGGGKKPWRQKGTGRARQGSSRSPLWIGGGVVFGPHPRDFGFSLPQKIRKAALRESLNAKFQSKDLCCVVDIKDKFEKTKEFAKVLNNFKFNGKVLALLDGCDTNTIRSSRNIRFFNLMRSQDVNAHDVLQNKKIFLTKTAFNNLLKRIK